MSCVDVDCERPTRLWNDVWVEYRGGYGMSGKEQKRRVCEWIRGLKFPDGYVSNHARCINMTELRMHGMKSHDYHVLMQKLIPIAFREMLPEHVWSALTEARRVVDESKWIETFAYQSEKVVPVPIVATDNQTYNLRDPNGLQVVVDLSIAQQHVVGTSRRQGLENDDVNEDEDEDSDGDDETDNDEYDAT
ncbi:hypothetical protein Sango_1925200 [Sesamum angolense]|uniref:Uncharacterized protein n=1 Tax=Sesamum angolense TaxID=2727404 RepID=A0AAE2BN39_9LAMI|nr:hypothetical protein Sango_1925200 [Sesamum angolense]